MPDLKNLQTYAQRNRQKTIDDATGITTPNEAVENIAMPAPGTTMSQSQFGNGGTRTDMNAKQKAQLVELLKKRSNPPD